MNPREKPPLSPAKFAARLKRAMQRHAAARPAYWPTDKPTPPALPTLEQMTDELEVAESRLRRTTR